MNLEKVLEQRKKHYWIHLLMLLLWIPVVILLFKFIEPIKIASIFASLGFLAINVYILLTEYFGPRHKTYLFIASAFFLVCTLPVPLLRFLYWDMSYSEIVVVGVRASALHEISNVFYISVMVMAAYCLVKTYLELRRLKSNKV